MTPFVSLPASDVAICLCLFYQDWSVLLQLCHLHSLTMVPWGKPHTQIHIYIQHDTYGQRLSCHDMRVVISVTSHCVQHVQQLSKWVLYNDVFSVAWLLVFSSHLSPLLSPSSCQAEEVRLSRHLICLVLSLALWPRCDPQIHDPPYRFNVSRCVAVMHGSAAPCLGF